MLWGGESVMCLCLCLSMGGSCSSSGPLTLALSHDPSPQAVCSPLTCTFLVIVHGVFQGLQEDFLPGLLKLALLFPILHSFHLAPWPQGLCLPALAVIVEEGLVVEEGGGLKPREAFTGPGQPSVEKGQRVGT